MSTSDDKRAVAYLRVSGKSQIDGDGFPRQRECVDKYAARNGIMIVEEFRDEAVSGTKEIADRQGLAFLLDRIQETGIKIVLVETSQRIARDLMVGEVILGEFRKIGVKVIECDGGNDLTVGDDNPTGKLIRQILGAVAEYDKTMLVLKLRAARERKRRLTGKCCGTYHFGFDPLRPQETRVLYAMLACRKRGNTWASVSRKMNACGYRMRSDLPWDEDMCRHVCKSYERLTNAGRVLPDCRSKLAPGAVRNNDQVDSQNEAPWGVA